MSKPGPTEPESVPEAPPVAVVSGPAVVSVPEVLSELPPQPEAMTSRHARRTRRPTTCVSSFYPSRSLASPGSTPAKPLRFASPELDHARSLGRPEQCLDCAHLPERVGPAEQRRPLAADRRVQVLELEPVRIRRPRSRCARRLRRAAARSPAAGSATGRRGRGSLPSRSPRARRDSEATCRSRTARRRLQETASDPANTQSVPLEPTCAAPTTDSGSPPSRRAPLTQ